MRTIAGFNTFEAAKTESVPASHFIFRFIEKLLQVPSDKSRTM